MLYNEGSSGWENIVKSNIDHQTLFSYYLGFKFKIGKCFNSPLRKDEFPSFGIFRSNSGDLMYKDFSTGDSGDIIKFVCEYFKISRTRAVIKCLSDAYKCNIRPDLPGVVPKYTPVKNNVSIGIKPIPFDDVDRAFWNRFAITEDTLNRYRVVSTSHTWVNNSLIWLRSDKEPMYAYLLGDRIKIYRPYSSKRSKWLCNTDASYILGIDNIPKEGDLLIITKSLKDVMLLNQLGYNAISPNGETVLISNDIIQDLRNRFKKIIVFLDNDSAGIKAANKYKEEYNLDLLFLPNGEKDISDYIEVNGLQKTIEFLKENVNRLSNKQAN